MTSILHDFSESLFYYNFFSLEKFKEVFKKMKKDRNDNEGDKDKKDKTDDKVNFLDILLDSVDYVAIHKIKRLNNKAEQF